MIEFKLEGLEELNKKCKEIGLNLDKKAIRPALKEILKEGVKKAKANAPIKTGELKKHISWRLNRAKNGVISGVVLVKRERTLTKRELKNTNKKLTYNKKGRAVRNVYYAHFVEYGTKHLAPRPFIRNAIDEKSANERLKKAIDNGFKEF